MDRGNNKFNKDRNKFNPNQLPPQFYPHNKKPRRISPKIPYDQIQNPNLNQSDDLLPSAPYPQPVIYPNPIPIPQNKENFMKNAMKMYNYNLKNPYMPYPMPGYLNIPENDMSLEDNALMASKKFNENKRLIKKRKKNIHISNKDLAEFNNDEINGNENEIINNQNIANSNENLANPEFYYNNDYFYNNRFMQKMGKKKPMPYNKNRNKKIFKKKEKRKFDENYMNSINNKEFILNKNSKPFYPKKKFIEEDLNVSDLDNNNSIISSEGEEDKEEEEIENDYEPENKDKINKDASDDIIILDNSSKEISSLKNIKLIEKKTTPEKSPSSNFKNKKKNKIIPELDKMCSEKEIAEREANNDIDRLEIDADAFPEKKGVKERMVQKYCRKRGIKLNLNDPKEIRNIKAINQSIEYLIEICLDCDTSKSIKIPEGFDITPLDIIPYIYDRFLAIYKTIELLYMNDKSILNDNDLIFNIGKMIRTVIIFLNLSLDYYDQDDINKEINNYIDNLLLPLLDIIKDYINNDENEYEYKLSTENEDEFLCYYLFIKLKKERNNFEKIYKEIKSKLDNDKDYNKIELVNEIYLSLKTKNYENFINIIKDEEKCDYFISCLMSLFFKEICVYGLQKIALTKKELPYKEIKDLLTFEDVDEVRRFLIWYGINKDKSRYTVNESDIVPIVINNPNKKFLYEKAFQKTNKRLIENKRGDRFRKDEVNKKINFIKNENYKIDSDSISDDKIDIIKEQEQIKEKEVIPLFKNTSIIKSDISENINKSNIKEKDKDKDKFSSNQKIINGNPNSEINKPKNLENSFLSQGTYNKLFPPSKETPLNLTPKMNEKDNINDINKSETKIKNSDFFLKPYSPKRISFDSPSNLTPKEINKSIDFLSHTSISSIEPQKNSPNFTEQTLEFFCEVANSAINKLMSEHKLNFIYRLKFLSEKYKIKLDLIENYINRRKFFVFNEFKKCCLDKKYSREYINELINYKNNINSVNTNENSAFKIENKNISLNKNFEFFTYDDLVYFLINNYQNENKNINEQKDKINHLQINIYTTKDLIKSTKLLSGLKIKNNLIEENEDGTELTINNSNLNINLNSISTNISFIMKFIFIDQIIDLESYIYENQNNIQKYSILIPFFDIIKSDPENQQILTKFFTILDLGLGSYIKKDIIFFFIKRDIEPNSDIYKEYQNIQNDFIFNLMQKYSINSNRNNDILNIDENYERNEEIKKRIIYLSPIDEFGKCYQKYIKYLNNKTFVELFENNKLMKLCAYNPKEVLIPFDKHISELDIIINHYISLIEQDLKIYLEKNNNINYFFNKKLCIEILIGFVLCKILLIYYKNKCLIFANELYKIPSYNSNDELLFLENNLLNAGTMLRQINLEGYDYVWEKCINLDKNKIKDIFSFFDVFSQMISSYNLIAKQDMQTYEYTFRKQYYDINIEKKDYEVAKNFVNYFNKIISKFVQNNNLKIQMEDTTQIFEKIYAKNKTFLISTIAKIITNSDNLIFNENLIYVKGLEKFYLNLRDKEIDELHNNLNKKRKRHIINNMNNLNNKKNAVKINKHSKLKENNNSILNNIININESIDKSKEIKKASFFKENGDLSDDYIQYFRNVKKISLPDGLI